MISDIKLQLILTLYKNDKLTFEEVKTLITEESPKTTFPIDNPWVNPLPVPPWYIPPITYQDYTTTAK